MEPVWEIVSVFLLSTIKFVFGAVPYALLLGFSFFETITVTSLGGFTGVVFFVFSSDWLIEYYKRKKALKKNIKVVASPKQLFTRKNKIIVYVKRRFGLLGISLLTPLLLSIPIGCFLAVRYFKHKQKIISFMFGSILFWSVFIASFKLFFN